MSMSSKDKQLLIVIGLVLLFGFTFANFKKCMENISTQKNELKAVNELIGIQKELIASKDIWAKRYDEKKPQMPTFKSDLKVDTHWLDIMDRTAERHGVKISDRDAGDENKVGDVYEFTIEVKNWESELEPFINFMYSLQSEGVMLDIRTLTISPIANNPGLLKGSFILYCAYMRDDSGK